MRVRSRRALTQPGPDTPAAELGLYLVQSGDTRMVEPHDRTAGRDKLTAIEAADLPSLSPWRRTALGCGQDMSRATTP